MLGTESSLEAAFEEASLTSGQRLRSLTSELFLRDLPANGVAGLRDFRQVQHVLPGRQLGLLGIVCDVVSKFPEMVAIAN